MGVYLGYPLDCVSSFLLKVADVGFQPPHRVFIDFIWFSFCWLVVAVSLGIACFHHAEVASSAFESEIFRWGRACRLYFGNIGDV